MTLTHKIILLVSFMFFISLMVFWWFTSHLFQRIGNFKQSMAMERQHLETQKAKVSEDLQSKSKHLLQEGIAHLDSMKDDLDKNQQKAEEFDKEFLKGQNEVFDAIEDFNAGKKPR